MPCLATVTTDVWFDATGPAPARLHRYSRRSDGPEVNRLCEGPVLGSWFHRDCQKNFFSSVAIVADSLEVNGGKLRQTIIV
jgi:hypothetical protein